MEVQPPPPAPPSWSNLVKNLTEQPKLQAQEQHLNLFPSGAVNQHSSGTLVGSCNSSKGIAVAVVDANAIIQGGERLAHSADRFVSVSDVIAEIRDPASRHSLNFLPFTVDTLEPSSDALKKVISFAKATGDLQTLSDVDLKLIALTYMLEAQIHGTQHLRDMPPPIHTVNVKRLPEKDLPGWGSNVPNLEEWEALEHLADNGPDPNSRILGVKDLSLHLGSADHNNKEDGLSLDGSESNTGNHKRYLPKKREVKIEGKKMVADGIDASQGEIDENADEWLPAVSRSTHRKYLRRKARRETSEASSQLGDLVDQEDKSLNVEKENLDDDQCPELLIDEKYEERISKLNKKIDTEEVVSESLNNLKLEDESSVAFGDDTELIVQNEEVELDYIKMTENGKIIEVTDQDSVHSVITSQKNEYLDDLSSEQSWTLRSLSESSVACITGDFAMQNVILQMGLRLLAPGGMQIHELHRWVLKCHACFKVTTEIGRIFCPTCGNGGTLRKVAVTVSETGIVLASRKPHVSIRGTKFSLPLPQGGRDAVTKNPVLREDQLPHKYLYPKTKKNNNKGDEFIIADDIFRNHSEKKAPLQPPVRKAVAVFSGKRNPNDNHYARVKC